MKNLAFVILTLITIHTAYSQAYTFRPKWKVGDKRTITITQHDREIKDGELVEDTITVMGAELAVLEDTPGHYLLKVVYENVALRQAVNFYEKMGSELGEYNRLDIKYKMNKATGKAELENWKEMQEFITGGYEQISKLVEEKTPEMKSFIEIAFGPVMGTFSSKENIEAYMTTELGYLLFPYDKTFVRGDTLEITESAANPFNPRDTISSVTRSYLSKIDEISQTCDINTQLILDLSGFKEMIKTMMSGMADSFGADEKAKQKAATEIDGIYFDMINEEVTTFNYHTTWPEKVVRTAKVIADDPQHKSEKTSIRTITFK